MEIRIRIDDVTASRLSAEYALNTEGCTAQGMIASPELLGDYVLRTYLENHPVDVTPDLCYVIYEMRGYLDSCEKHNEVCEEALSRDDVEALQNYVERAIKLLNGVH